MRQTYLFDSIESAHSIGHVLIRHAERRPRSVGHLIIEIEESIVTACHVAILRIEQETLKTPRRRDTEVDDCTRQMQITRKHCLVVLLM
jgi:hypothetical protein